MPSHYERERRRSRSRSPDRERRRRDDDNDDRRRRRYDDDDDDDDDRQRYRRDRERRERSRSRSRDRSERDHHRQREGSSSYRNLAKDSSNGGTSSSYGRRSDRPLPSQSSALATAGVPASSSSRQFGRPSSSSSKHGNSKSRSPSPSAEAIAASKPNFANSGALAAETNTFKGVVLKYNEPPEARKPTKAWRLYVFKGSTTTMNKDGSRAAEKSKDDTEMIPVNRQSAYLFGRDRNVADIPIDHPSASKQHAVLQFRSIHERNEFGDTKQVTKPYLIDLESANGTTVNQDKLPPTRYYELQSGDVIKFAYSTREYVLLAEQ